MGLANVMVVLGNNGRYATLLLLPLVALLHWEDLETPDEPHVETQWALRALALVLPILLFTTLIGHQIWSEDAGEVLAESWQAGDDTVLLVAPESMAMHHLYVLKTNLDVDGSVGVHGVWSTPEQAPGLLEEHAATIDYVLIAPDTTVDTNRSSWVLVESRDVPVSVPGGIQSGAWSLYRLSV
jgi:hypothetical protein